MKTKISVTRLDHEELVDILSTALYGCDYLQVNFDSGFYHNIPEHLRSGSCFEDVVADILLQGGEIEIIDWEADGVLYPNKKHPQIKGPYLDESDHGRYYIRIEDILAGCSSEYGYKLITEVLSGEGDYFTANNLLQLIMFGEVIYG